MGMVTVTPYDSLIVAAGAQQSYFGHDEYAAFAPGMKSIDDALELRGRILGAFEAAEVATDPAERQRRLTFVVVGAGPTGVELAGEIVQLAERTLAGAFRTITPANAGSSCSTRRPRCCRRWAPSWASRRSGGCRRWTSRSSSTRW